MSWYVKNIIKSRLTIRNSAGKANDIENDLYSDLLAVEKAIEDLDAGGMFTKDDMDILNHVALGNSMYTAESQLGMKKSMLYYRFGQLCDRISFYLGGHFTDDGYLQYMVDKYKLSEQQIEHVKKVMTYKTKKHLKETNE